MGRYRRYTKTIVKAPRKKWNFASLFWKPTGAIEPQGTNVCYGSTITENSADNATPTPVVIKAKRVKISGQLTVSSAAIEQTTASPKLFQFVVVYFPQVCHRTWATLTTPVQRYDYVVQALFDHPEWVMGRKIVNVEWDGGTPGEKKIKAFSFTSGRLSRNLRSGDKIMLFYISQYLSDNHMYTSEQPYANIQYVTSVN